MESYTISVPDAAWQLLRQEVFVATLLSCVAESDGRFALVLTTLSGDQMRTKVEASTTVSSVASSLRRNRGLSSHVNFVIVGSDGATLPPTEALSTVKDRMTHL